MSQLSKNNESQYMPVEPGLDTIMKSPTGSSIHILD